VFVDGRQTVAAGKVLTLDQAEAGRRLADAQRRMLDTAPRRDYRGRNAEQISPLSLPLGD
jgi:5-methylthioadenosine/S-adenosylhomocysteine deaminase